MAQLHSETYQKAFSNLCRILPFLWSKNESWVRYRLIGAVICILLANICAVIAPFFYKQVVDSLVGNTPSMGWLSIFGVMTFAIAHVLIRFMDATLGAIRNILFLPVQQRGVRIMACRVMEHLYNLDIKYHLNRQTGVLSQIIRRCVGGVEFIMDISLFNFIPLVLQLIGICIVLFFVFDVRYLFIVIGMFASYATFTYLSTQYRLRIRRAMIAKENIVNQMAIDSMLNYETVKYFANEAHEVHKYDDAMHDFNKTSVRFITGIGFMKMGQALLIKLWLIVALALGVYDVYRGVLSVGDFVVIHTYVMQVMTPLTLFGMFYLQIRTTLVNMGQAFELLDTQSNVQDYPHAPPLQVTQGEINFNNVRFGYNDDRHIIKGISFTVKAGQTVAIVGPSGSGKTTIGRLLCRFYDITDGTITIDGQDISRVQQNSLQHSIGVIPQDTVLFNDTLLYNISYGCENISQYRIEQVAKMVRMHDFIMQLPDGYNTVVGERGLKLSGGEKQRISIARTILKNPKIAVLDEATSALDTQTERHIQQNLHMLSEGRTVIAIAHRLSTIVDADNIVVLNKGEIIEQGCHKQLLQQDGTYAKIWNQQLRDKGNKNAS